MSTAQVPAPGARVLIRDAEWVVRRVDMTTDGACQLVCDGVSELVREQEAFYLSSLEEIEVLDPARTRLTPDRSPGFADSLLFMESQLRATVPNDDRIHVGHQAAMDLVPYQLDPARQALARPRQRILIADAVGLGKTLEAGILVSELIASGRGQPRTPRIVYLVTESANETIRSDTRILEVLEQKDRQAYENVGDPSAFMNVHDIDEEERITAEAMASGEDASRFDARLTPRSNEGDELLALFLGTSGGAEPEPNGEDELPPPTKFLFASDLRYCEAALHRLRAKGGAGDGGVGDLRFEHTINAKLDEELQALEELKARRYSQLEIKLGQSRQSAAHKAHRETRARRDIDQVFNDYLEWIQETMSTEREPWLKVLCAMVGAGTGFSSDATDLADGPIA